MPQNDLYIHTHTHTHPKKAGFIYFKGFTIPVLPFYDIVQFYVYF